MDGEFVPSFKHKSVLLTGATSGIGRATALALARRGASVATRPRFVIGQGFLAS